MPCQAQRIRIAEDILSPIRQPGFFDECRRSRGVDAGIQQDLYHTNYTTIACEEKIITVRHIPVLGATGILGLTGRELLG
jgi:hypothetical protein